MKKPTTLSTRAIHGKKLHAYKGPLTLPIYQTSTYRFDNSDDAIRYANGDESVYVYSRYHNPSVEDVEEKIALMNDAEACALFASGMAAISTAVLTAAHAGDEIISTPALYGGTYRFFRDILPNYGITVRYVDPSDIAKLGTMITGRTKIVYTETPTNPTLDIVDIKKLVTETRKAEKRLHTKISVMADNTFGTCMYQQPFDLGCDVIVESATKYYGGHSDLLAGVVVGTSDFVRQVRTTAKYLGGCADPFAAFLLSRSLKTFAMRVEKQTATAMKLASALEANSKVLRVIYPGLKSHPRHQLARRQMSGYGAMVTIEVKGGAKGAVAVTDALCVAVNAMSLGGVETLVSIPVYSSHVNMTDDELARHGVAPGMIRISVGAEGAEDLIADFEQALRKLR
ncbi:MAG: trans-sulfuration enzyme family protein [Acidobacteriota bacterium]